MLPRNRRIENKLLSGRKVLKNNEDWNIFYAAWSGITNSESVLLRSWFTKQLWHTYVPHQALITSISRKPSREVGMPRNTRENMSIPGNVFDGQHARREPEELYNYSRKLATPSGIADDVEEQMELRIVEAKNHCNENLYLAYQQERGEKFRRQIILMSMTNHALGIWTCTQVAWQFRVISLRRCICKISWPNEISELDREFQSRSLRKSS